MITDRELIQFDREGIIPGPSESGEQFEKRARLLTARRRDEQEWESASQCTQKLFGFSMAWMKVDYSNKKLRPWEGAAIWIDETSPVIQLRKSFQTGSYLKYYQRDEVLAHEAVHAARSAFSEPQFEEYFAYSTSPYSWRRIFGPLLRTPWESYLFVGILALLLIAQITMLLSPLQALLFLFVPVSFALIRLFLGHRTLRRCRSHLSHRTPHPDAVMLRLTDREIAHFASSPSQIRAYIEEHKTSSLRWRLLHLAYFS